MKLLRRVEDGDVERRSLNGVVVPGNVDHEAAGLPGAEKAKMR